MENKIINEKLNLIKKCVESYQIIPDNVAIMLMEQITNILSTIHVCGEEQRKFLDEIEGKEIIKYSGNIHIVFGGIDDGLISRLDQKDFKANFEKVINGE